MNHYAFLENLGDASVDGGLFERLRNSTRLPTLVMLDSDYFNEENDETIENFRTQFENFATMIINE